jgi:hypothetical protein
LGPDYCRGCAALDRDCGLSCPYAEHAPVSAEGAAVWAAGMACVTAGMAGPEMDMAGAMAMAKDQGVPGWAAASLLAALRSGIADGIVAREAAVGDGDANNGG